MLGGVYGKKIIVTPLCTLEESKKFEGRFIDSYSRVIREDTDVYYREGGETKLLFHFRKAVIPNHMLDTALSVFKKEAVKASSIRGKAAGPVRPEGVSPNIASVISPGKFKTRVVFKDGTESNYYVSNKVNSLIAGYFDKPKLSKKHTVVQEQLVPCRTTAFTEKNEAAWHRVLPMIKKCDSLYRMLEGDRHGGQLRLAAMTPDFQIGDTAFSTLTVNYNWRTACHVDSGDYHLGYSVILVAEEGNYMGGILGYPRFDIGVDVRHGDFLLKDPHQYHANTPLIGQSPDWTRLSMVLYYREGIQKCYQMQQAGHDVLQQYGGESYSSDKYLLQRYKFPNRNIDLDIYIRPETTDIKVIEEVLKKNVYEKPKIGFYVSEGERWLDLGGNIGTFALLALAHGASVVTCEPEQENLELLQLNLETNFDDGWEIMPVAVTTSNEESIDLYLCKGEYNKYRHTVFPKRGRQSIRVSQENIRQILQQGFTGIKMDIEGSEIEILEYLAPLDYKRAGVQKMVFEYSFDIDPSIPRFLQIVDRLRQYFSEVHYTKVKEDELTYKHFPAATLVFCKK